jgi:hypothetical protein
MSEMERIERIERWFLTSLGIDVSLYGEAATVDDRCDRVERAVAHCLGFSLGGRNGVV